MKQLLLVLVACIAMQSVADAGPIRKFLRRKKNTTTQYQYQSNTRQYNTRQYNVQPQVPGQQECTQEGGCPDATGNLTANRNGGFENQLTYAPRQQAAAIVAPVQQPVTPQPTPPPKPQKQRALSIADAMRALELSRQSVGTAENLLALALQREQARADAEAQKLREKIAAIENETKARIAALEIKLAELPGTESEEAEAP